MLSGGVTEAISYFAGFLRIYDDTARDRDRLDGTPHPDPVVDYAPRHSQETAPLSFDDPTSKATPAPNGAFDDLKQPTHIPTSHPGKFFSPHPHEAASALPMLPVGSPAGGGGGGSGSGSITEVKLTYDSAGPQGEIQSLQINSLFDNDLIGTDTAPPIMIHLLQHSDLQLEGLIEQVSDVVPPVWRLPHDTDELIAAVGRTDANWTSDHGGSANPPSVSVGYYENGTAVSAPPVGLHSPLSSPFESTIPDTGHSRGQWADVGDNHSSNAAQIVDLTSACPTMVVLGNYYATNAIFQVNGSASHADINVQGGTASSNTIDWTPVESTNDAGFVQHASVFSGLSAGVSAHWDIDAVHGDFYSIHILNQVNYLVDNDVVQQLSSETHYDAIAGQNHQMNLDQLTDGAFSYDLIIVGGSYHTANLAYQYNILVNNDIIASLDSEGASGSGHSISAGGSHLTNAATFDLYGGENLDSLNDGISQIVEEIASGQTSMDPSLAALIHSYGGNLHVLYVSGDFYDVNYISQRNLIEDSNYVTQNQSSASAGNPLIAQGAGTQSVVAGHDMALNLASIVDVGPDQIYVGGQVYSDCMLVQANLLPQLSDDHAHGSVASDQLASEIIAFLNDTPSGEQHSPVTTTVTTTVNDDTMSSIMH